MSFLNPRTWKIFGGAGSGSFVSVYIDYGFGEISEIRPPDVPVLYIKDISAKEAEKKLANYVIDWHKIPMRIRRKLETNDRYYECEWDSIREYLKRK